MFSRLAAWLRSRRLLCHLIRNATIAKILYLNKSIEQFGSGFKRINSLCKDAGIRFSYESDELGFKFILYRPELQSDIPSITLDVTLNGTEMAVLSILKQKPDSSRSEIADKISKTVRTVQRALDSLRDKGYIQRVGSKQEPYWEALKESACQNEAKEYMNYQGYIIYRERLRRNWSQAGLCKGICTVSYLSKIGLGVKSTSNVYRPHSMLDQ